MDDLEAQYQYIPEDRYNTAERSVVIEIARLFFGDTCELDLDGIGGFAATGTCRENWPHVKTIHAKIHRGDDDEPIYYEDETPAIGVSCTGQPGETPQTLKRNEIQINCVIDIVVYGGDIHYVDEMTSRLAAQVQSIIAHNMQKSKDEAMAGYFCGASGGGRIESDGVVGLSVRYADAGIIGEAGTSLTIVVRDEGYTPSTMEE